MASSGEDSFTGSRSDDNLLAQDDTTDIEVEVVEVEQSQLTRKRSRSQSPRRAVLPTNLRSITLMLNAISKRLHGHDIDANLSLPIVAATLELQKGYLEERKKAQCFERAGGRVVDDNFDYNVCIEANTGTIMPFV